MFVFVVKDIREEKGYALEYVAEKAEVTTDYLEQLEYNNLSDTSLSKLYKIARVLEVDIKKLYYSIYDYETLRQQMHNAIDEYGLNAKETRRISDLLDLLLNLINKNS